MYVKKIKKKGGRLIEIKGMTKNAKRIVDVNVENKTITREGRIRRERKFTKIG